MKWISVIDRLPNEGDEVFVWGIDRFGCVYDGRQMLKEMRLLKDVRFESGDFIWEFDRCCGRTVEVDATHWMPVPEEPK